MSYDIQYAAQGLKMPVSRVTDSFIRKEKKKIRQSQCWKSDKHQGNRIKCVFKFADW